MQDDPAGSGYPADGCYHANQAACHALEEQFSQLGIRISNLFGWTANMLERALAGVMVLVNGFGGMDTFVRAMNGVVNLVYGGDRGGNRGEYFEATSTIVLYAADFVGGDRNIQTAIVHELAHHWDARSGPKGQRLSDDLRGYLDSDGREDQRYPSNYALTHRGDGEDFAESVTATLLGPDQYYGGTPAYGNDPATLGYVGSSRDKFIKTLFCIYASRASNADC